MQAQAMLADEGETHMHLNFIERLHLRKVVAGNTDRDEPQAGRQFFKHARRVILQEQLPAAPLPCDVADVVDVTHHIGFIKRNDVAIHVRK